MRTVSRAFLLLLLALATAEATPRISVLTRSPGSEVGSSFGHTILRIDRDGDLSTVEDQQIYEYGVWALDFNPTLNSPEELATLFTGLLDGEQPARKQARNDPGVLSPAPQLYPDMVEHVLTLSEPQLEALVVSLDAEFAELDGVSPTYTYRHFSQNCATEWRDRIFAVLPPERRAQLEARVLEGANLRALISEDLEQAFTRHDGRLRVMSQPDWEQHGAFLQLAGGLEYVESAEQLFGMIEAMVTALGGFLAGEQLSEARQTIAAASERFQQTLSAPVSAWQATYTPARLLRLLEAEGLVKPAIRAKRWF